MLIADLSHPTPAPRIDFDGTKVALALAFAGGATGSIFAEALARASIAPSSFDARAFERDLFLGQFVGLCMRIRIEGHEPAAPTGLVTRMLASPPADPRIAEHRRAILDELSHVPELARSLETLYLSLCRLRGLFEGAKGTGSWDQNRRQLDILQRYKEIIDLAADRFSHARSGLSALASFGRAIQASEPYQSLADLLRYDEQLATMSLQVKVGADGRIRGFVVSNVREEAQNPFVVSPLKRWLARLELFVRGFKFSEGEVMARLIDAVYTGIEDTLPVLVQLYGDLELYLGALGFQSMARSAGLHVCLPRTVGAHQPRALSGLFNPLLLAHGMKPVPCSIQTDKQAVTVLVTGPNSGGKTRLLQSIALTQLLAQVGLFVPAREASIADASGLVVSLIEEQRADQSEGRLGTELKRIRELFERLPPGAMVILDELCSGTNPSEGEEIFELVVQMLAKLSPFAFITTHFLSFAARLEPRGEAFGLRFLQVELGAEQRPTYQFVPGVARTSLASHAASRLGVTRDQLLSLIERNTLLSERAA